MGFVGGDVGGDEEDAVGAEDFAGALAGDEVAVVDGVEGSAVDQCVHGRPGLNTKSTKSTKGHEGMIKDEWRMTNQISMTNE